MAAASARRPYQVADAAAAKAALAAFVRAGDSVLLKASHGMHLEAVLA